MEASSINHTKQLNQSAIDKDSHLLTDFNNIANNGAEINTFTIPFTLSSILCTIFYSNFQ